MHDLYTQEDLSILLEGENITEEFRKAILHVLRHPGSDMAVLGERFAGSSSNSELDPKFLGDHSEVGIHIEEFMHGNDRAAGGAVDRIVSITRSLDRDFLNLKGRARALRAGWFGHIVRGLLRIIGRKLGGDQ